MSAYVVMYGTVPLAVATSLEAAQADVETRRAQSRPPAELRWDENRMGEWRLMSRMNGQRRFSWSAYWVAAVPTLGGAR